MRNTVSRGLCRLHCPSVPSCFKEDFWTSTLSSWWQRHRDDSLTTVSQNLIVSAADSPESMDTSHTTAWKEHLSWLCKIIHDVSWVHCDLEGPTKLGGTVPTWDVLTALLHVATMWLVAGRPEQELWAGGWSLLLPWVIRSCRGGKATAGQTEVTLNADHPQQLNDTSAADIGPCCWLI